MSLKLEKDILENVKPNLNGQFKAALLSGNEANARAVMSKISKYPFSQNEKQKFRNQFNQKFKKNAEALEKNLPAPKNEPAFVRPPTNPIKVPGIANNNIDNTDNKSNSNSANNEANLKAIQKMGIQSYGNKNYPDAEKAFKSCLKIKPKSCICLSQMGKTLQKQNKIEGAKNHFKRFLNNCKTAVTYKDVEEALSQLPP